MGLRGVGRELLIGIAPLLLGLTIWVAYIGLAAFLTIDGSPGFGGTLILIAATLVTANATYHALPSPQDMTNVFRQPFSLLTIPCYLVAAQVWIVGHTTAASCGVGPRGMCWSLLACSTPSIAWWRQTCFPFCPVCRDPLGDAKEAALATGGLLSRDPLGHYCNL